MTMLMANCMTKNYRTGKYEEEVDKLHESNPMMGLRGIRLSIVMPEIVEMQVRAIFEAACDVKLRGFNPKPEIVIPLTGHVNELKKVQPRTQFEIAKEVMSEKTLKSITCLER